MHVHVFGSDRVHAAPCQRNSVIRNRWNGTRVRKGNGQRCWLEEGYDRGGERRRCRCEDNNPNSEGEKNTHCVFRGHGKHKWDLVTSYWSLNNDKERDVLIINLSFAGNKPESLNIFRITVSLWQHYLISRFQGFCVIYNQHLRMCCWDTCPVILKAGVLRKCNSCSTHTVHIKPGRGGWGLGVMMKITANDGCCKCCSLKLWLSVSCCSMHGEGLTC